MREETGGMQNLVCKQQPDPPTWQWLLYLEKDFVKLNIYVSLCIRS